MPICIKCLMNGEKEKIDFSDASYYTIHKGGQGTLLDMGDEQNEIVFKQMKKYKEYRIIFML